jgi:hypothetical protein
MWATFGFWRFRRERPLMLYLFCMSAPVFFGHMLYSFRARILPNWIAPAVPAMFLLMALYWHERLRAGLRLVRPMTAIGLALGIVMVAFIYDSDLLNKIAGQPLPGAVDPSRRLRAWNTAAQIVEDEREKLSSQGTPAFIIGDDYSLTGECTFYSPAARKGVALNMPLVYCVDSDKPANQFYFWPEYDYRAVRQGENAIYVRDVGPGKPKEVWWLWIGKWLQHEPVAITPPEPSTTPERAAAEFETVTDLGVFDVKYHDRVFHRIHLWACYHLK